MLVRECEKAGVQILTNQTVLSIKTNKNLTRGDAGGEAFAAAPAAAARTDGGECPKAAGPVVRFWIETENGNFSCQSLVVATGGLSVPKTGASDFGYKIARQFSIPLIETAPALDGFVFSSEEQKHFRPLSGVSADVEILCGGISFRENILFTHSGLSGPAALQASLYWNAGEPVQINFVPQMPFKLSSPKSPVGDLFHWFKEKKESGARAKMENLLTDLMLPKSFCETFCALYWKETKPLTQVSEESLAAFCKQLQQWEFIPAQTVGYQKAEVTRGGVDTKALSSKTMECLKVPGLYFIGEVVDVTGWLGGYNFQWAWASAHAAAQAV